MADIAVVLIVGATCLGLMIAGAIKKTTVQMPVETFEILLDIIDKFKIKEEN